MVYRGDPARPDRLADNRLTAIAAALAAAGLEPFPAPYSEEAEDQSRALLVAADCALVWVNPVADGRTRAALDALLREVAASGVVVSAHPDTIDAMGTKKVLFTTRAVAWSSDVALHHEPAQLKAALEDALARGEIRVLKRLRGNGGDGVYRVEPDVPGYVRVLHAKRGAQPEQVEVGVFIERLADWFQTGGVIDQAYQGSLALGMVRAYLVGDRVAGFGEQMVNALLDAGASSTRETGPRLYYPATRADLQPLRTRLEEEWVPELIARIGLRHDELPALWDADFFRGAPDGPDWVLGEINVSSVFPLPDSALAPLAAEVRARLEARRSAG
jgi:hypothetical protein